MKNKLLSSKTTISAVIGKIIVFFSFLFLVLLPFHLVIKNSINGPIGTYWKEFIVGILFILSLLILVIDRIKIINFKSQLVFSILLYLGYIGLRLILDGLSTVQWWGFYSSIMYLPIFFVILIILNKYPHLIRLYLKGIVVAMSLVALGGVIEFVIDKALWPSVELTTRQGFSDMYIYATKIRRVYFVFDSPTTLANTLALVMPIAIFLFITEEKKIQKIAYGVSLLLMVAAIIFTFSRGIWVAIIFTILLFVIYLVVKKGNKKLIFTTVGVFFVSLIIFFLILSSVVNKNFSYETYTFELNNQNYKTLLLDNSLSLFNAEWIDNGAKFQDWTIFDPIENKNDTRKVLYMHPISEEIQSELVTDIKLPENPLLRFSIALSPEIWDSSKGDGVTFKIYVEDMGNQNQSKFIFNRYINPKLNPNERRWRNYIVDLSEWSNEDIRLHLFTDSGPQKDVLYDWAGWADLELGQENSFSRSITQQKITSPIITHVKSIVDWANDETNRDRLWAWNSGISSWLENPIFGKGLGTTGVAALNTNPEKAIVTESQLLKSLVETGIPGLVLFIFVWYEIFRTILVLLKSRLERENKLLVLAFAASFIIIFIEGIVYQNLEVKQVNAYFWFFVGVLSYLYLIRSKTAEIDLNEE